MGVRIRGWRSTVSRYAFVPSCAVVLPLQEGPVASVITDAIRAESANDRQRWASACRASAVLNDCTAALGAANALLRGPAPEVVRQNSCSPARGDACEAAGASEDSAANPPASDAEAPLPEWLRTVLASPDPQVAALVRHAVRLMQQQPKDASDTRQVALVRLPGISDAALAGFGPVAVFSATAHHSQNESLSQTRPVTLPSWHYAGPGGVLATASDFTCACLALDIAEGLPCALSRRGDALSIAAFVGGSRVLLGVFDLTDSGVVVQCITTESDHRAAGKGLLATQALEIIDTASEVAIRLQPLRIVAEAAADDDDTAWTSHCLCQAIVDSLAVSTTVARP